MDIKQLSNSHRPSVVNGNNRSLLTVHMRLGRQFAILFLTASVQISVSQCPAGFISDPTGSGVCLFLSEFPASSNSAQSFCSNLGTTLPIVHDDIIQTALYQAIRNSDEPSISWHIGLRRVTGNTFQWVDNSTVDFTNWLPGQPATTVGFNCVSMDGQRSGQWYVHACTDSQPYICMTAPPSTTKNCAWRNCPIDRYDSNANVINVHLVPHSHDDLGWKKTVDQYFWGSMLLIYPVGVQYIYNTVLESLRHNPDRRFSFAETGFLWRWYTHASDDQRQLMKQLITNGQIEMIGGGWVQNDEATSHYMEIIDQHTLGLQKLNRTFGECGVPKVAWQIDPFGHSREFANLLVQMGYNALFFARLDYHEKVARRENLQMQMMWNTSDDYDSQLFTHIFYDHYDAPKGLCFDELWCMDEPIMDDPEMEGYNVDAFMALFLEYALAYRRVFRTNHIMFKMGSDFQYGNANAQFTNLDRLIYHVNTKLAGQVRTFYSTPSCFTAAVQAQNGNQAWPTKTDDFFPYVDKPNSYWTGYFTSRPSLKLIVRKASAMLQLVKQLFVMADLGDDEYSKIELLRRAVALSQHHDGVSGTSRQTVTDDYVKRISHGMNQCQLVIYRAFAKLASKGDPSRVPNLLACPLLNESNCAATTQNTKFAFTIFNSNSQTLRQIVRLPYAGSTASVFDWNGNISVSQVNTVFGGTSNQVTVMATVPPHGFSTYFVQPGSFKRDNAIIADSRTTIAIENERIRLVFDDNGLLSQFVDIESKRTWDLSQQFFYYFGEGLNDGIGQASGAYIFRSRNGTVRPEIASPRATVEVIQGPLVSEVRQTFTPWLTQVIRLTHTGSTSDYRVEFEWTIGPIPADDFVTKEVITRYSLPVLNNAGKMYTDANGRQILERNRRSQSSTMDEPIAGNYYPVNSMASIKDQSILLTVVTDRSQGAASLNNGEIEFMLHRRCFFDDQRGVLEALNEPGKDGRGLIARGRHWLQLISNGQSDRSREMAQEIFQDGNVYVSPMAAGDTVQSYQALAKTQFSGLTDIFLTNLPKEITVLSLEPWEDGTTVIRMEHRYQRNELSNTQAITINMTNAFTNFDIVSMRPLKLAANTFITDQPIVGNMVTLNPMEIKTFRLVVQRHGK